jgi:hypothetical protein
MSNNSYLNEIKTTAIRNGRLAMATERFFAASREVEGLQVMAIEHVAARLAGGLLEMVNIVSLREFVAQALPDVDMGELKEIQHLPGMAKAAASSLMKFWMSGIDPETVRHLPRMKAILALEEAVLERMPANMKRPVDLRDIAIERAHLASRIFGQITIRGMTNLHPVWQSLILAIAEHQPKRKPVVWDAGPRKAPEWLSDKITVTRTSALTPEVTAATCANARHEVVEAIRWVRQLMIEGVDGSDIAVATTSTSSYDDIFTAAAAEASLKIHFVHGMSSVHTADGQACAALADILLRGISQKRVRRLIHLCQQSDMLTSLPSDWAHHLKQDAALTTYERWDGALKKQSAIPTRNVLLPFIKKLTSGVENAKEIGAAILSGKAHDIWERALRDGPAHALDQTIPAIRAKDDLNPLLHPCFMSAENLASSPRRYVRLIGMTSHAWPRFDSEDALIPEHVIPGEKLNPMPLHVLDEADWDTICKTSSHISLSWPRRDGDGRKCEPSGILPSVALEYATELGRSRIAENTMSEGDRLFCRPEEFADMSMAKRAESVIRNWYSDSWTEHDGIINENHPRVIATLGKVQSATSLRKMLRDPISFVWQYCLGFRAPEYEDEPLLVDPRQFGNLLHAILQLAVDTLEERGGFLSVPKPELISAIRMARMTVGSRVATEQPIPPELIWKQTLDRAQKMAEQALTFDFTPLPGQTTYCEIPFGNEAKNFKDGIQLFSKCMVRIPGTEIDVEGVIDRLDLSGDKKFARVVDYKTGKTPKDLGAIRLKGGEELQRPIYDFAVRTLIDTVENVEAGLFYLSSGKYAAAEDVDSLISEIALYVQSAKSYLLSGLAVPGEGADDTFNQHLFALPANAAATYLPKSLSISETRMPALVQLWSEK